jgi:ATP-dependent exoDNAse (exonuclease V) alpha subunit
MTRGKKPVIVLGSKKALWIAIKQSDKGKRYSCLGLYRLSGKTMHL